MDLLFNQELEKKFYNSTIADLEIYYKNSLNITMSLVTKYYPPATAETRQCRAL
jgi:hypothetical protein